MPTMWQRDLEADRERLTAWLQRQLPTASDVRITDLVAPQTSGFSNETLLFDLEYAQGGRAHRDPLVVRIQPNVEPVFPEYDLGLQFRTMRMLAATDVPVPRMFWIEERDRRCSAARSTS
jgi:aminoglycoside phosphotransferase (APT) family kinase protein